MPPKPRSRRRKGCAPCHLRWDQGLSDSGPSACGPLRRSARMAGVGPAAAPPGPSEPTWTFSTTPRPRRAGRRGPAARCRGPRAAGPLRRRGRHVRARRPEVGDDGRPAQNGAEGRRRSEGTYAGRCQAPRRRDRPMGRPAWPGPAGSPRPRLRGTLSSPHAGTGESFTWLRAGRQVMGAGCGSGRRRRISRRSRSCPASESRSRTPMSSPLAPTASASPADPGPH